MKVLFIVQGEGRGHLTQAIALSELLYDRGYQITVLAGSRPQKNIPAFFMDHFGGNVLPFQSPALVYKNGTVSIKGTVQALLVNLRTYWKSVRYIHTVVKKVNPNVIINFYEPVGGVYAMIYRRRAPVICIAHQFLLSHRDFKFPKHRWIDRMMMKMHNRITSLGAFQVLSLSFSEMSPYTEHWKRVVPPLIRRKVRALSRANDNFILVYLTHHELSAGLIAWHLSRPEVKIHCFWDHPTAVEEVKYDDSLTFYPVHAERFIDQMSKCTVVVTTAGFESVCEAMYLGKTVMLVPVPGHFEQACNAADAARLGAVSRADFDLTEVCQVQNVAPTQNDFRSWVNGGDRMFMEAIKKALYFYTISRI